MGLGWGMGGCLVPAIEAVSAQAFSNRLSFPLFPCTLTHGLLGPVRLLPLLPSARHRSGDQPIV